VTFGGSAPETSEEARTRRATDRRRRIPTSD
jgi:hypothetical protein